MNSLIKKIFETSDFHKKMPNVSSAFYQETNLKLSLNVIIIFMISIFFLIISICSVIFLGREVLYLSILNIMLSIAFPFCSIYYVTNLAMNSYLHWKDANDFDNPVRFVYVMLFDWGLYALRVKFYFVLNSLNLILSLRLFGLL